jgi:hypothetical protein
MSAMTTVMRTSPQSLSLFEMSTRFHRGKSRGISPFFAFQDIITSAMAVVITIVMLLALDMGDPTQGTSGPATSSELAKKLAGVLKQLDEVKAALQTVRDKKAASVLNPEILKGQVQSLRTELEGLLARDQKSQKPTGTPQDLKNQRIIELEIARLNAAIASAPEQIAALQKERDASLIAMQKAESELSLKESQLLAEQSRKNELTLIPDLSKTAKEPVVVVVAGTSLIIQRLDNPEKRTLQINGILSQLDTVLDTFSTRNQYVVFFFKPSGVPHFNECTSRAKSKGFDIGYDAILEDVEITLGSSK